MISASLKHREFTKWMADKAEETLLKNDVFRPGHGKKPPWETIPLDDLHRKLDEEIVEFLDSLEEYKLTPNDSNLEAFQVEAADVAVTVMMMAANLDPEMSKFRRGR